MCFYQITNLDNRISNPDQIFTNDIEKWAYSLSNLYQNFSKPVLDIILFTRKLSETLGYEGPLLMIAWYVLSGFVMRFIAPPFGKLTAIEQSKFIIIIKFCYYRNFFSLYDYKYKTSNKSLALEGEFRACHSALITHSEEIAFYKGNAWEKERVNDTFKMLTEHISSVYAKKFFMGIFDSMLVKYGAVMIGYSILGLPVFGGKKDFYKSGKGGNDASMIAKDYIRNSGLLINLAKVKS